MKIAIVILIIVIATLCYVIYNLMRKQEIAEDILGGYLDYLTNISTIIQMSDKKLKELDNKDTFKGDDEVGFFFDQIKNIQEILNQFNIKKY